MKTIKNIFFSFLSQLIVLLVPIITTPYLSRVLGVGNIGTYSYYYSIANYFGIFIMLGLSVYGVRTIAKYSADKNLLSKNFWGIYTMQLSVGMIVLLAYIIFTFLISDNALASFILLAYVVSNIFDITWFFFGIGEFVKTSLRNSIIRILTVISIFLFVRSDGDLYIYFVIMALSFLLSQLSLWPFLPKKISFYKPSIKEVIAHLKPNLFLFLTVLAISIYNLMDKIMLGIMTDKIEVGYYESAQKIIQVPIAFITAMGSVMLSRTSATSNSGEDKVLRLSFLFSVFIMAALCFGIMAVSKEFVPLFYGDGYDKCVYLYLVMLPASIFIGFGNVVRTQYLLPNQKDVVYVISGAGGAVTNLIANLLLIPSLGCIGAGVGTLLTELVVCLIQCIFTNKFLHLGKYIIDCFPFALFGILMFLSVYFIPLNGSLLFNMICKIFIGAAIYLILCTSYVIVMKRRYGFLFNRNK